VNSTIKPVKHPIICQGRLDMTCYFRHLKTFFKKAGIKITSENRREIDKVIHGIVGIEYKKCPATWREVKNRIAEDEETFILTLKEALKTS
jgi:hypothetical protein